MAEDPLHDIIETVRARLKTELETQLEAVSARHAQALEEQRSQIEAEAEQRWAPQLQAARAEVEQQATAAAAARAALDDLQQLLEKERALAESRLQDERRTRVVADPAAASMDSAAHLHRSPDPAGLVERLRAIDAAATVSDSLAAIARAAARDATHAALYIANEKRLEQLIVDDSPAQDPPFHELDTPGESIVVDAFRNREPISRNGSACAIPMLLDGTPVAVLYGEVDPKAEIADGWRESLETIARHGAARLGYLTAVRTAQARQWLAQSSASPTSSSNNISQDDASAAARRYARLVVSEIKLYNERAVEQGRSQRDLLTRLGPEIDRARRLFEERVPVSVPRRSEYFQQELVQTLAGGDPSLLG